MSIMLMLGATIGVIAPAFGFVDARSQLMRARAKRSVSVLSTGGVEMSAVNGSHKSQALMRTVSPKDDAKGVGMMRTTTRAADDDAKGAGMMRTVSRVAENVSTASQESGFEHPATANNGQTHLHEFHGQATQVRRPGGALSQERGKSPSMSGRTALFSLLLVGSAIFCVGYGFGVYSARLGRAPAQESRSGSNAEKSSTTNLPAEGTSIRGEEDMEDAIEAALDRVSTIAEQKGKATFSRTLWKLDQGTDSDDDAEMHDRANFRERHIWVSTDGYVYYTSQQNNRDQLLLTDRVEVLVFTVLPPGKACFEHAVKVSSANQEHSVTLACDSKRTLNTFMQTCANHKG